MYIHQGQMPPKKKVTYDSDGDGDGDGGSDTEDDHSEIIDDDYSDYDDAESKSDADADEEEAEEAEEEEEDEEELPDDEYPGVGVGAIPMVPLSGDNDDIPDMDDEDDAEFDSYFQKFNATAHQQHVSKFHPELQSINNDELQALCTIVRDAHGNIVDPLHTTMPRLTKYERTRVLCERTCQIENGAPVFIELPETVNQAYVIAEYELAAGVLPFIISRPLGNGMEYWKLKDLEVV